MFSLGSTMTYDRFLNLYFLFEQRPLHTKKLTKKKGSLVEVSQILISWIYHDIQ